MWSKFNRSFNKHNYPMISNFLIGIGFKKQTMDLKNKQFVIKIIQNLS